MRRTILTMFIFIFYLSWAEVKVEKVLETTSIKEYNQWVKKNKAQYPGLNPIYVQIEQTREPDRVDSYEKAMSIERTMDPPADSRYINEYKIYYYDESGSLENIENVNGYVEVWPYKEFDYVRILRHDHPIYPSKSIVTIKDRNGKSIFPPDMSMPYVIPTELGFFIEYPVSIEGGSSDTPTTRIFSSSGKVISTLQNVLSVDATFVSPNKEFIVLYALGNDSIPRKLILMSKKAEELWRKEFPSAFEVGFSSNQKIAVGDSGRVHIYDITGNLLYTYYVFNDTRNPMVKFFKDDRYLVTLLGSEIHCYDDSARERVWKLELPETSVKRNMFVTNDGSYTIIVYNSHNVYVVDNKNGAIVRRFNVPLGSEWRYKKILQNTKVVMKKYEVPASDWECIFTANHLIFEKGMRTKKNHGLIIVLKIG